MGVVIRPVLPRRISAKARVLPDLEQIIIDTLEKTAKLVYQDFLRTVATWDEKPRFTTTYSSDGFTAIVATDNEVYGYVNSGTKPHVITPKAPGYPLRWSSQYTPKTRPRVIGSYAGGSSGVKDSAAYLVHHPGTKARNFNKEIAKRAPKNYQTIFKASIKRAKEG